MSQDQERTKKTNKTKKKKKNNFFKKENHICHPSTIPVLKGSGVDCQSDGKFDFTILFIFVPQVSSELEEETEGGKELEEGFCYTNIQEQNKQAHWIG